MKQRKGSIMFTMKKRIGAILLVTAMLAPLASCAGDTTGTESTDTTAAVVDTAFVEETTTVDPNDRTQVKDNLPENLKFNGDSVRVLYRGDSPASTIYTHDVGGTDNSGDYVTDSVWARNRSVEDRLGVVFVDTPMNAGGLSSTASFVKQLVMAGTDEYDYLNTTGNTNVTYSLNAYLRDLAKVPYIDYEQPWWWMEAIDALSLDGKTYNYIIGDILVYSYLQTGVMFYNKQIYENIYGDPEEMYKTVMDGQWTMDKLIEMSAAAYKDVDGDGTENLGDQYGCIRASTVSPHFFVGLDIDMYHRDENGNLIIEFNQEEAALATEKMYKLWSETIGIFKLGTSLDNCAEQFASGNMLFFPGYFSYARNAMFREMEQPYGLLPFPKLNEEQEEYVSIIHSSSTNISVMKSVPDDRMNVIGAALEALCAESWRSVMPQFLDSALKLKYSPDQMSGQVVDLVIAGVAKNTLDEYATFTGDIFKQCLTQPAFGSANFASTYAKLQPVAQKTWDKAVAKALQG